MRTVLISIGTELTNGRNLDTNSQWLSQRLSEMGISVCQHVTVSDDLAENVAVFGQAVREAELVVATGGLGPTADDLTREVLAGVAGVELEWDAASLSHIEGMFRARNRAMPERNRVQAMCPKGATMIPNPVGTAPGLWMEIQKAIVVCMPGVPREMIGMWNDWVAPRLHSRFGGGRATVIRTIRTFGAGESHVEEMLGDLIKRGRDPEVGITASEATISLRIVAHGNTPEEARAKAEPDLAFIRGRLGELVVGEDNIEMEDAVGDLLLRSGKTVATAESCTGGLIGHLLTQIPGSSSYMLGGLIVYSNQAKSAWCDVPGELIREHGAVSREVATALARGVRTKLGADFGIGVTGIAGPGGGSPAKPVGLVYIGLADEHGVEVGSYNWPGDRSTIKLRSAKTALNMLRLRLLRSAHP